MLNHLLISARDFMLSDVTANTDSVGVFRGMIALLGIVVLLVALMVPLRSYGKREFQFAAVLMRFGLGIHSLAYWVLILGASPLIGSTTSHLTWVLMLLYFGQIFLLIAIGLLSKARAFNLAESTPSNTNWVSTMPDRRSSDHITIVS